MRRRNTAAAAPCGCPATGRSPAWSAVGSSRPPPDGFPCPSGSASPTQRSNPSCVWRWKESSTDATIIASPPSASRKAPASPAWPSPTSGGQYIFQVDDLPLEGLSLLHVRFDLMGQGEVWVDDVQLFDLAFNGAELRATCTS